jgi:RNase P/RNase MRP subunit p30
MSILNMSPAAIIIQDLKIDKKALGQMRDANITLCLATSTLTASSGLYRSRNLYMMRKLFDYARSIKLDVSFITLAHSNSHLCSYIQLLELAKLVGAEEEYARKSISKTNCSLVME